MRNKKNNATRGHQPSYAEPVETECIQLTTVTDSSYICHWTFRYRWSAESEMFEMLPSTPDRRSATTTLPPPKYDAPVTTDYQKYASRHARPTLAHAVTDKLQTALRLRGTLTANQRVYVTPIATGSIQALTNTRLRASVLASSGWKPHTARN